MKKIICIALLLVAGCKKTELPKVKETINDMKTGDTTPVQYVNSLQKDVEKAQDAAAKANAVIQKNDANMDNALKEAGQ